MAPATSAHRSAVRVSMWSSMAATTPSLTATSATLQLPTAGSNSRPPLSSRSKCRSSAPDSGGHPLQVGVGGQTERAGQRHGGPQQVELALGSADQLHADRHAFVAQADW